jgi:hypothetical protein
VAGYDNAQFSRALTENVVFAQHNLAMDRGFNLDADERVYRKIA